MAQAKAPKNANRVTKSGRHYLFLNDEYRLAMVGHSQTRNVADKLGISEFEEHGKKVKVEYWSAPTYRRAMETYIFESLKEYNPHFVVTWIVGNEVGSDRTREQIKEDMGKFYDTLRETLPHAIIISTNCENRFYREGNLWKAPTGKEFQKKRNCINVHMNRKLKNRDYRINLAGDGNMDGIGFYEDDVHYNLLGLRMYMEKVQRRIRTLLEDVEMMVVVDIAVERLEADLKKRRREADGDAGENKRQRSQ